MFTEDINKVSAMAVKKKKFLEAGPLKYFVLAMMAGFFAMVGIAIAYTTGGIFKHFGSMYAKLGVAATFSIALDLIYFAGAELFTGNNFVMGIGVFEKKTSVLDYFKVLSVCYLGNFAGIALFSLIYIGGGAASGSTMDYLVYSAVAKASIPPMQAFLRAILCNFVVCLAVWICVRMKEETARVIVIFWAIFAFCIAGFEHSIANMGVFFMALFAPDSPLTVGAALSSTLWVTLGNMVGGTFLLGIPYWFISKSKDKDNIEVQESNQSK